MYITLIKLNNFKDDPQIEYATGEMVIDDSARQVYPSELETIIVHVLTESVMCLVLLQSDSITVST